MNNILFPQDTSGRSSLKKSRLSSMLTEETTIELFGGKKNPNTKILNSN